MHTSLDLRRARGAAGEENTGGQCGEVAAHAAQGAFKLVEEAFDGNVEVVAASLISNWACSAEVSVKLAGSGTCSGKYTAVRNCSALPKRTSCSWPSMMAAAAE